MGLKKNDRPVTADDDEAVRQLHAEGLGRNEIARRLNRGPRTVSIIAARLGLTFDVTMTEEATRHRVAQLAEKRAILADALMDDALRLSEQLWEGATIHSFGGKDHTHNSHDVDEPLAVDKKNLMAAATAAAAQSLRLVPPESDAQGLAAVDQWLRGMMSGEPPAE
ncbi:helix-turn-helix domain-containing protein [Streptomyces sp. NPDC007910]|uniref:helix-turn-helix domain-containing protein n=1 Tax=Streptomyces sp. NPDC007910 TaxID=3364790 RepID=UPI0036E1CAF6